MQAPLLVRPPTEEERQALAAGLRSADAFAVRRCQAVLASARGKHVPAIARALSCCEQTVRAAIRAFDGAGPAALTRASSRPRTVTAAFDERATDQLLALLRRSPREFGHPTSLWTLELAAEVAYAEGITPTRLSRETVRTALLRRQVRWRRAKRWITSPDPAYAQKNSGVIG
jgi:transposase